MKPTKYPENMIWKKVKGEWTVPRHNGISWESIE